MKLLTWPEQLRVGVEVDLYLTLLRRHVIELHYVSSKLLVTLRFSLIMLASEDCIVERLLELLKQGFALRHFRHQP